VWAWIVATSISSSQHANTIELEIAILTGVIAALGGIFRIGSNTGKMVTRLDDLAARMVRLESRQDAQDTSEPRRGK
jgi:hypothetical protein